MSWSQRPALDGLRTIAVYLVLLYHCGVSTFSGGFVGVDLFFVLSGFLVTSVLLDELSATGTVRLRRFYARRVRRLLPAALVVILATSALFLLLASTPGRAPWVNDARGALLYVANWRFIVSERDYFAADINTSPFLHFWSLAIEEQFYLVLPLLLWGLYLWRKRWPSAMTAGLSALLVIGIGLQVFWALHDPSRAYYGTDARIYQLLVGVLAAWWWHAAVQVHLGRDVRRPSGPMTGADRGRALASWLALAGLLFCATEYLDVNTSVRGFAAAACAIVLIWSVTDEWSQWLCGLLSRPTMTYLGKVSYATYLWHWPVLLAFRRVLDVDGWAMAALVAAVATGLAALSARLLEMPVRRPSWLDKVPGPTIAAGLTASIVCAVGFSPWLLQVDTKPRLLAGSTATPVSVSADSATVPQDIDWAAYALANGESESRCIDGGDRSGCLVHRGSGPTVALVGDSHAQQLAATVKVLAEKHDFTLYTAIKAGCSWQRGLISAEKDRYKVAECTPQRERLYAEQLQTWDTDVVLLAQRERVEGPEWHGLISTAEITDDVDEANRVTIARTLDTLAELQQKVVVVQTMLQPVQAGLGDPLECLATATYTAQCAVPAPATQPIVDSMYRVGAMTHPDQQVVDLNPVMCPDWPECSPVDGDVPVWRDDKHFNSEAIQRRHGEIWKVLAGTGFFG